MKKFLPYLLLTGSLSACAPPIWVAGHTSDYSEVYSGRGVGGPGSNWTMSGLYTGVTCSGSAAPTGLLSSSGMLSCSDGQSTRVDNAVYQGLSYWSGRGSFGNGIDVILYYDDKERTIKARLDELKQSAALRRGAPPSSGATVAAPAAKSTAPPPPRAAAAPTIPHFPRGAERPDDVAVIIGNGDYARLGKDIPNVRPAHADAEGARIYATQALGIKEGNVILLKDATSAQLTRVFGSEKEPRGQLFDWVKPGRSRVYVYYSGHGAPGSQGGSPYLIPTDADSARIELNGYPLKQLYDNLGKLPAESVTVVLEACFSGISPAGSVLGKASPVFFDVKAPPVPGNVTVITAGAANQMASWETDESSGLFTKYYLKGMAGEADSDKDGRVSLNELERYLKDTLTYYARRHYGRDQQAQIVKGGGS